MLLAVSSQTEILSVETLPGSSKEPGLQSAVPFAVIQVCHLQATRHYWDQIVARNIKIFPIPLDIGLYLVYYTENL